MSVGLLWWENCLVQSLTQIIKKKKSTCCLRGSGSAQIGLYKVTLSPHASKANIRKCHRKLTWPQWSESVLWQTLLLTFPHPEVWPWVPPILHYCSVRTPYIGAVNGSQFACSRLIALILPARRGPTQRSYQGDCPLTAHLSDILGTPSVTRFCHNNVWMWVCVLSVCLARSLVAHVLFLCFLFTCSPQINPAVGEHRMKRFDLIFSKWQNPDWEQGWESIHVRFGFIWKHKTLLYIHKAQSETHSLLICKE